MSALALTGRETNYISLLNSKALLPFPRYKKIIVADSGGKDSLAALLALLLLGVPKDQIEVWHHLIDGAPGTDGKFDWPITESYVKAVADALGIVCRLSWKDGGFEDEMFRDDAMTKGVYYEDGDGIVRYLPPAKPGTWCRECRMYFDGGEARCKHCGTLREGFGKRMKYPMKVADLNKRWCSAYLKIDVCKRILCNDPRFSTGCILLVSGERRQESTARAKYHEVDEHKATTKLRFVQQWRAVIDWSEADVWDVIRRFRIQPHPAYRIGWGRVSCMCCIFGDKDQWASVRQIAPAKFDWHAQNERRFGLTIDAKKSLTVLADAGTPFVTDADDAMVKLALSRHYPSDMVFVPEGEEWQMPAGAFKRCGGPL